MDPYGNIGGAYSGAYAGGYRGYGTYGAYTGEDGVLTYDINAEGMHLASLHLLVACNTLRGRRSDIVLLWLRAK